MWANAISEMTGVPVEVLIADMVTESSRNLNALSEVGAEKGGALCLFQARENFMDKNGWSKEFPFRIDCQILKGNAAPRRTAKR